MIKETERLKRLQHKLQRQVKGSINHYKTRSLIACEYQKITNKKNELANQLVAKLAQKAAIIVYQDDNIAAWKHKKSMARGSRTVQYSVLGRVKSKLSQHPRSVMVPRFAATTKTCVCGVINNEIKLGDTIFKCSVCEYSAPRDVHAAQNMINFIPVEDGKFKPAERKSDILSAHAPKMHSSTKQETIKLKTEAAEAAKSSA